MGAGVEPLRSRSHTDQRGQGSLANHTAKIIGTAWFDIGLSIFGLAFGIYAVSAGQTATTVIGGTLIGGCFCLLAVDARSLWRGRSETRPRP